MPHVREAAAAPHDDHDALLVAALAAGDLTGTDRDQAVALTASCAECAALHADLVAIARATATLPPPVSSAGRDFRLTQAQAESLRRTGWRRFLPLGGSMPLTRPLGAALATFGIVGLLIGTQPLAFLGASTTVPTTAPAAAEQGTGAGASTTYDRGVALPAASAAASAAAGAVAPEPSAAASAVVPAAGGFGTDSATPSIVVAPYSASVQPVRAAASSVPAIVKFGSPAASAAVQNETQSAATSGASAENSGLFGTVAPSPSAPSSPSPSPLVLISLAVFAVGVVLFVASYRGRRTSL